MIVADWLLSSSVLVRMGFAVLLGELLLQEVQPVVLVTCLLVDLLVDLLVTCW